MRVKILQAMVAMLVCAGAQAQVNSGSDGHDGAFTPTTSTVINMADHPDGIYHYTEVNIPDNVIVSFIPNAANTPVVWLVQGSCTLNGNILLDAGYSVRVPGGHAGGDIGGGGALPGDGTGPGGGGGAVHISPLGGNASYATQGGQITLGNLQLAPGAVYGNEYCVPLNGGSGGGGSSANVGGAGGGAILIASSDSIHMSGYLYARGGCGYNYSGPSGGGGSGGAVRLVATRIDGRGYISVAGGYAYSQQFNQTSYGGNGWIRLDALANAFSGDASGSISRGYQPIIIPPPNQAVSLAIQSVGGVTAPANPTASPTAPDVVVPGAHQNPVPIVVRCVNIPLNTDIIVEVKPANGPTIRTVGVNSAGTQASSTATVSVTMPRGAGTIQAKCVSGIAGTLGASLNKGEKFKNYAQTGLTADGEVFAKMEITATLGGGQEIAYLTESGKRYSLPSR